MANSSKARTLYLTELSLQKWFRDHLETWFLTFTLPGVVDGQAHKSKEEVEVMFKPFRDLCRRRKIDLFVVWERQARGAWHPHCLVDARLECSEIRQFMVARGWGHIMKFEYLRRIHTTVWSTGSGPKVPVGTVTRIDGAEKVTRYLCKYLTKSLRDVEGCEGKKVVSMSSGVRAGTVAFKWVPWVRPGAMLYACGLSIFLAINGEMPRFKDINFVIRLGVEDSGWASVDPWWEFGFPGLSP